MAKAEKSQETKDILVELDKREKKNKPIKHSKIKTRNNALSQALEHKETDDDDTLNKRRLIVNDVTVEKLGELLKKTPWSIVGS
ncbi:DUF3987 domain-containing protein [Bartonella krasnovii]|nr:DUF3987 domain-containing protein [Bartonella krasnovii]